MNGSVSSELALSGSARQRAAWSMLDQALSSGTNFLLLVLVIRTSSTSDVGAFSMVYTGFFLLLAVVRGLAIEPLVVRWSAATREQWQRATASATGLVLVLAVIAGGLGSAIGFAVGDALGAAVFAGSVMLPGLLLQDSWRLAFFSLGQPRAACVNDAFFLVAQVGAYILLVGYDRLTMVSLIVGWGFAAAAAATLGVCQSGVVPHPGRSRSWYRENCDIGPAFAGDHVVNRGSEQAAMVAIGTIGGLVSLGAVATARSCFAPLTSVQSGLQAFAIPELARLHGQGRRRHLQIMTGSLALLMGALMAGGGVALALLPDAAGTFLLQANWGPAESVLLPMTLFSVVNAAGYGVWAGLRAMQLARSTLYVRGIAGAATVAATAAGASAAGASGAVWGLTIGGASLLLGLAWLLLRQPDPDGVSSGRADMPTGSWR